MYVEELGKESWEAVVVDLGGEEDVVTVAVVVGCVVLEFLASIEVHVELVHLSVLNEYSND